MPWGVRKKGSWWEIYKSNTGKVVGKSSTKSKADASVRARGGRLSEQTISMHDLEHICATVVELNEMAESEWKVQTLIFDKDEFRTRDKALSKAKEMGFSANTTRETGDEEEGSWRVRQESPEKFSEFRTQKVKDTISIVHGKLKPN